MSEKFQTVLYYKKRIIIGGKLSIGTMVSIKKKKFANFDKDNINNILDEYLDDNRDKGREEIVSTWIMIDDDEKFTENALEVEYDENFVEWEERSKEIIKQKNFKL